MRNDHVMMKDLSVHTRLSPEQRMREVGKLIDYINKYVKILSGGGVFSILVIPLVVKGIGLQYTFKSSNILNCSSSTSCLN